MTAPSEQVGGLDLAALRAAASVMTPIQVARVPGFGTVGNRRAVLALCDELERLRAERDELLNKAADHEAEGYASGLRWAADVAHAEARWQLERYPRGAPGSLQVADRAQVLEQTYREAAERYEAAKSGPVSDAGAAADPMGGREVAGGTERVVADGDDDIDWGRHK